ncbi:MAG: extracellular solute-binding protein [Defluviitaleaceae bacterium]|nr:extracellular solute-binding protein [Defluviitaleaceae bacterium]
MKTSKKILLLVVGVLALALFAACGRAEDPAPIATPEPTAAAETEAPATTPDPVDEVEDELDYTISILTISHSGELISVDHPAIQQLEELSGYNIELDMILNANFAEQMNMRLAAGDLPGIVVITGNTLPIVQAAQGGALWDLTDHIPQWENLAGVNPDVMNNVSIGGRHFGIYRQRPVGRPGMVYRSDWLEYLDLAVPATLEDLFNVLVAFTENDPQPNGGNTYGMAWTGAHMGPFHDLAVMHGAPNRWEVVDGEFVPWFEHEGFIEALEFSRELFALGAINPDFAALPPGDWALQFGAGLSGWHMDVSDEARRSANRLRDNEFMTQEEVDAGEMVWVMGTVANRHGESRIRAHAGHAGYVAISTTGAPTPEDLQHHLAFLNAINSPQGQNIVSWGAEGYNWEMVDGRVRIFTPEEVASGMDVVEGLNQFMMRQNHVLPLYGVNSREDAITEVQLTNIQWAVHDPSLALMSDTWTAQSGTLNQIIDDAVILFVMGTLDMAGFRNEVARWYAEGGQASIDEFTAALAAR